MKKPSKVQATNIVRAGIVSAFFAVVGTLGFVTVGVTVNAAPGSPGVPEAPVVIFEEDFQNTPSTSPVGLLSYTGADGMGYTAAAPWLTNCNGEIVAFNTPDTDFSTTNCDVGNGTNITKAYDQVRRLAYALGQLNGMGGSSGQNKALTAYTDSGSSYVDPGAGLVQLETQTPIVPTGSNRRFIISGIDGAAVNCNIGGTVEGRLVFYLLDNGTPRQVNQTPFNVCDSNTTTTPPVLDTNGALGPSNDSVRSGHYVPDSALLTNSNSLGLRVTNLEGGGQGNDNALDNIRLLDASPKLDKSFAPMSVGVNGVSRMTFTVTNTTDLLAKQGWSFTDNLPGDLLVSATPNTQSDCPNYVVGWAPDRKKVDYNGDLNQGQVSCTMSIDVTSAVAGTYTNGQANLSSVVGVRMPADAVVKFLPKSPNTGIGRLLTNPLLVIGCSGLAAIAILVIRHRSIRQH